MRESYARPFQPLDLSSQVAGSFPLRSLIEQLRHEDVYGSASRTALTLVNDDGLKTVLTVANQGAKCGEHSSPEPTVIVCLAGSLAIKSFAGRVVHLHECTAAALAPGVNHSLFAVSECAYLTILGSRPKGRDRD